jgi:prephenate dehydratase
MRIATLGPEGTFSHEAALKFNKKPDVTFANTVRQVFTEVELKNADIGIVPIENSVAGTVGQTLDCLMDFELRIIAEEILPIKHNLVGFGKISDVKTIYTHPQTYEQCERFLKNNLPDAEIIQTSSNGKSAEMLVKKKDKNKAAIVPKIASEIYKLKILSANIQDKRFNVTRFFVIADNEAKKTGYDRTSIAIYPQIDKPGLLHSLLGEFAERKINLTKIESRPSKGRLGDYIFFIDLQGHRSEKKVQEAFEKIEEVAFLKILGSYPRKY